MGNTNIELLVVHIFEDHPHIHGEYISNRITNFWCKGSPPHTWGILIELFETTSVAGITPTYMGNTMCPTSSVVTDRDHPHIHGEYSASSVLISPAIGSPPHTWGIRLGLLGIRCLCRITPTYMGNTATKQVSKISTKDHPHIHGEYQSFNLNDGSKLGSPPHTWGIPLLSSSYALLYRITPTYMGNTELVKLWAVYREDHPHIHGEY